MIGRKRKKGARRPTAHVIEFMGQTSTGSPPPRALVLAQRASAKRATAASERSGPRGALKKLFRAHDRVRAPIAPLRKRRQRLAPSKTAHAPLALNAGA